jgi:hypothetical protein
MSKWDDNRFIRISVVESVEDSREILEKIKSKFEYFHSVETLWDDNAEEIAILIRFPSTEAFYLAYKRDIPYYELFLQILSDHSELNAIRPLSIPSDQYISQEDPIYCILKYETNDKKPLHNYYQFIFRVCEMLGVQNAFEETEYGFMLFYKRKLDFELSLLDLLQFDSVIEFLKENQLFTPQNEEFVVNIIGLMKTS